MTHDELLEAIDFLPLDGLHAWMQPALRAVVKLHKPVACEELDGSQGTMCINCRDGFYPCLTIQVIENELE